MADLSRREFLGGLAAARVAGSTSSASAAQTSSGSRAASRTRLEQFGYGDVRLTGGPLKAQFDRTFQYYLELNDDGILHVYRQLTGLPAPGPGLGGWYDANGYAPGHCFGQWLSAFARFHAATGDDRPLHKLERLIDGFDQTLRGPRSFYAGFFPGYCYDKHVLGLIEADRLAGISRAREVLARATDRGAGYLPKRALTWQEQEALPHTDVRAARDEPYTMPENLFLAHDLTGDRRYFEMARGLLYDRQYFDPLSRGENVLPGKHAYSHCNALSSAARAYLSLGDEKYLRAARNAWDMLETTQWFASGGWGPDERFVESGRGLLGDSLFRTANHFETPCGSYAHFKLARYLMRITADPRYGDGLERMLYNGILATKEMGPSGRTFYYSDYGPMTRKRYFGSPFPCCAGTYPQVVADYLISSYFHDDRGVFVNLYVPSELKWGNVRLIQETEYPESETTRLTVHGNGEFSIRLRVPRWTSGMTIRVNDREEPATKPGTFAEVRRQWRDGDRIEARIPMPRRELPVDDRHPELVAVLRGPVMLVAAMKPKIGLQNGSARADVEMIPFYQVRDEVYTTYLTRM